MQQDPSHPLLCMIPHDGAGTEGPGSAVEKGAGPAWGAPCAVAAPAPTPSSPQGQDAAPGVFPPAGAGTGSQGPRWYNRMLFTTSGSADTGGCGGAASAAWVQQPMRHVGSGSGSDPLTMERFDQTAIPPEPFISPTSVGYSLLAAAPRAPAPPSGHQPVQPHQVMMVKMEAQDQQHHHSPCGPRPGEQYEGSQTPWQQAEAQQEQQQQGEEEEGEQVPEFLRIEAEPGVPCFDSSVQLTSLHRPRVLGPTGILPMPSHWLSQLMHPRSDSAWMPWLKVPVELVLSVNGREAGRQRGAEIVWVQLKGSPVPTICFDRTPFLGLHVCAWELTAPGTYPSAGPGVAQGLQPAAFKLHLASQKPKAMPPVPRTVPAAGARAARACEGGPTEATAPPPAAAAAAAAPAETAAAEAEAAAAGPGAVGRPGPEQAAAAGSLSPVVPSPLQPIRTTHTSNPEGAASQGEGSGSEPLQISMLPGAASRDFSVRFNQKGCEPRAVMAAGLLPFNSRWLEQFIQPRSYRAWDAWDSIPIDLTVSVDGQVPTTGGRQPEAAIAWRLSTPTSPPTYYVKFLKTPFLGLHVLAWELTGPGQYAREGPVGGCKPAAVTLHLASSASMVDATLEALGCPQPHASTASSSVHQGQQQPAAAKRPRPSDAAPAPKRSKASAPAGSKPKASAPASAQASPAGASAKAPPAKAVGSSPNPVPLASLFTNKFLSGLLAVAPHLQGKTVASSSSGAVASGVAVQPSAIMVVAQLLKLQLQAKAQQAQAAEQQRKQQQPLPLPLLQQEERQEQGPQQQQEPQQQTQHHKQDQPLSGEPQLQQQEPQSCPTASPQGLLWVEQAAGASNQAAPCPVQLTLEVMHANVASEPHGRLLASTAQWRGQEAGAHTEVIELAEVGEDEEEEEGGEAQAMGPCTWRDFLPGRGLGVYHPGQAPSSSLHMPSADLERGPAAGWGVEESQGPLPQDPGSLCSMQGAGMQADAFCQAGPAEPQTLLQGVGPGSCSAQRAAATQALMRSVKGILEGAGLGALVRARAYAAVSRVVMSGQGPSAFVISCYQTACLRWAEGQKEVAGRVLLEGLGMSSSAQVVAGTHR